MLSAPWSWTDRDRRRQTEPDMESGTDGDKRKTSGGFVASVLVTTLKDTKPEIPCEKL